MKKKINLTQTVWKFSNFPVTMILREINFGRFQNVKNCHLNHFEGSQFLFLGDFTRENVKNSKKYSDMLNMKALVGIRIVFMGKEFE